jgi:hypothetical protein
VPSIGSPPERELIGARGERRHAEAIESTAGLKLHLALQTIEDLARRRPERDAPSDAASAPVINALAR